MVAMEPPALGGLDALSDRKRDVFAAMPAADPAAYVRGQYEGYQSVEGVAAGSTTETYAALRLWIDNWRWSGVPFLIRAGKSLPVRTTEVRIVFQAPPPLGFADDDGVQEPNQLVLRVDPAAGARLVLQAQSQTSTSVRTVDLDVDLGGPNRTHALRGAAARRDRRRRNAVHPRGRRRGDLARAHPAARPAVGTRAVCAGHRGPAAADRLAEGVGGWREPWA